MDMLRSQHEGNEHDLGHRDDKLEQFCYIRKFERPVYPMDSVHFVQGED